MKWYLSQTPLSQAIREVGCYLFIQDQTFAILSTSSWFVAPAAATTILLLFPVLSCLFYLWLLFQIQYCSHQPCAFVCLSHLIPGLVSAAYKPCTSYINCTITLGLVENRLLFKLVSDIFIGSCSLASKIFPNTKFCNLNSSQESFLKEQRRKKQ